MSVMTASLPSWRLFLRVTKPGEAIFEPCSIKFVTSWNTKSICSLIDPFPPTKRDPHGLHAAIWAEIDEGSDFRPPPDKPLTLVAYEASVPLVTKLSSPCRRCVAGYALVSGAWHPRFGAVGADVSSRFTQVPSDGRMCSTRRPTTDPSAAGLVQ